MTNREVKKVRITELFLQQGNEVTHTSARNICAEFVEVQTYRNQKQITLDTFL